MNNTGEWGVQNQYSEMDGMAIQKVTFEVNVPFNDARVLDINHILPLQDGDPYTNSRFIVKDHLPKQHGFTVNLYPNSSEKTEETAVMPDISYVNGEPSQGSMLDMYN